MCYLNRFSLAMKPYCTALQEVVEMLADVTTRNFILLHPTGGETSPIGDVWGVIGASGPGSL